jgi:hypothetical protein
MMANYAPFPSGAHSGKEHLMDEFVICSQCVYWEECENKEDRDGCYFGVKEEDFDEDLD